MQKRNKLMKTNLRSEDEENAEAHILVELCWHIICVCVCVYLCLVVCVWRSCGPHHPATLTDEEDGEGDEQEKDMWHHIERVQETAVVQNPPVHIVRHWVILIPAERQGHGGTGALLETGRRKMRRRRSGRRPGDRGERDLKRGSQSMLCFQKECWWQLAIDPGDFQSDLHAVPFQIQLPNIAFNEREKTEGERKGKEKGSEKVTVRCSRSSLSFPAV